MFLALCWGYFGHETISSFVALDDRCTCTLVPQYSVCGFFLFFLSLVTSSQHRHTGQRRVLAEVRKELAKRGLGRFLKLAKKNSDGSYFVAMSDDQTRKKIYQTMKKQVDTQENMNNRATAVEVEIPFAKPSDIVVGDNDRVIYGFLPVMDSSLTE